MYQVVKMYGDFEPWWLLEGWQDDIVMCDTFDNYQEALAFYKREWQKLSQNLSGCKEKKRGMVAFWDPNDQRWCEECEDYLQQYHSLLILNRTEELILLPCGKFPQKRQIKTSKQCKLLPKGKKRKN